MNRPNSISRDRAQQALEALYEAACDSHHGDMTDAYACLRDFIDETKPMATMIGGEEGYLDPDEWLVAVSNDKCQAGQDGDCIWSKCPQLRDGEPGKTNRSCPLWDPNEDD